MKKILSAFLIAGILVACDDSKKDEPKDTPAADTTKAAAGDTKTSEPATGGDTTKAAAGDTKTSEPAAASADVPKFADAEVQKMADEYAAFMKDAMNMQKDPSKAADYAKKAQEWSTKTQDLMKKLASNPEELKKWSDFAMKLAQANMPK